MSYDFGFDFRATDVYVTDAAGNAFNGGAAYPTSYTLNGRTTNAGWTVDRTSGGRDRDSGVDARFAGTVRNAGGGVVHRFHFTAPDSGPIDIYLAVGDIGYDFDSVFQIIDSDGTTVLYSHTNTLNAIAEFCDASGVIRTSVADWIANNVKRTVTPSNGTDIYIDFPDATVGSFTMSGMAHARFTNGSGGGGATVSTITGTTVTEASSVVFTTTMSGTGGGTFAYSWSGTATSADYTSTLTTGMCAVTGGSGSVTVSGSNITVDSTVTAFTVTVPTTTDTLDEANETMRLVIGGVTSSSGTINDDDTQPTCTISDATEVAGTVTFVATLSAASGRSLSFDYATADGTKTAGVDYTAASDTVTFAAGETTKDIVITAL